ncbi:MAG: cyclase family protein [Clostridia bacterium]|nr:cyclase family protein [Clostridia bacterium]
MELRIIDISKDILDCPVYPGDPEPKLELVSGIRNGDACNTAKMTVCLHTGTHADAPLHFIDGAAPINHTDLSVYIGECVVVECSEGLITGETVNSSFPKADRILVKGNGKAFFDVTAAEELTFAGVKLIGTDAASVGVFGNEAPAHKAFLREKTAILENLDLSAVQPGKYFLMAQPLKIKGVEAAPCRAVLIEDYLFWGGKRGIGAF